MNKGLVMEKHRNYMIVLTPDGLFQKAVPTERAEIGEEVDFEPLTSKKRNWNIRSLGKIGMPVGLAAVAVVLLLIAIPAYFMPAKDIPTYAYVSIDINPSIELQVDKEMHVKELTPLNKDAETLKPHLGDIQGEDLDKVVDNIMIQSEERNLIANGKKMLVGVSYVNGQKDENPSVLKHLRRFFSTDETEWNVATYDIPANVRKLAREENRSANELLAKRMLDPDSEAAASVSEKDKEMIHSFYEKKHKDTTKKVKDESKPKENQQKKDQIETGKTEQVKNESPVQYEQPQQQKTQTQQQANPANHTPVQKENHTPIQRNTNEQKQTNPKQTNPTNNTTNSSSSNNPTNSSNYNNEKKQNYEEKKEQNNNYNENKNIDYKNNNPYRNKDYNQYKNRGQQYRNQNNDDNNDDDDDN